MIELREAKSAADYNIALQLFQEYAEGLGFDLSFQNFAEELANIAQQYATPTGALLIVFQDETHPLACAGVKNLENTVCELKRMYVRSEARGQGIGRMLLEKAIVTARELGYKKMRLDTLPSMQAAISLYQAMGFYEIEAYRFNPFPNARYFELVLH